MVLRLGILLAVLPVAVGITCPMLGCSVDGSNTPVNGGQLIGIDTSKKVGKKWSTLAAGGEVVRLLCTSDDAGPEQLLACGVNRNAPSATGTWGLVGVRSNGSVAWTDYEIGQALAHPVRSLASPGGAMVANDRVFVGDDKDGQSYGPPRQLPMLNGSTFSMPYTQNGIVLIAARGRDLSVGAYLFNSVPHASTILQDPQSHKVFHVIGTPIVNGSRGYFIAQESGAIAASPNCGVFAVDVRRTLNNRLPIAWVHKFRCPPNELRHSTAEDQEVPLLTRNGALFFPAGASNGSLLMMALDDAGSTASVRFSREIDIVGAKDGTVAMRSISMVPADADSEADELLVGFAPSLNSDSKDGSSLIAQFNSRDGSFVALHDLSTTSAGSFRLAPGARIMVLPKGMLLPESSSAAIDLAFMAVNKTTPADVWMLGVRIPRSVHRLAGTAPFEIKLAVQLGSPPKDSIAKPGIQVVPLSNSLVASVGGEIIAVGELNNDKWSQLNSVALV